MRTHKLLLLVVMMLSATQSFAFDDKRQGFLLGLGIGLHDTDIDFTSYGTKTGSATESGLATSFKIGGGITDQFALYYVRNASWFNAPYYDGFITTDETYVLGLSGIGASYFLSPSGPSAYFIGAVGIGDFSVPTRNESDTGSAVMFGAGYEFQNHVSLEATLLSTNIDSGSSSFLGLESRSFQFTINYNIY